MSERATMIHPAIESLLDKVDSKFSLVSLAAKRGRQINSYFSQLGEGLGTLRSALEALVAGLPAPPPGRILARSARARAARHRRPRHHGV